MQRTLEDMLPHLSDRILDPLTGYLIFGWTWQHNRACSPYPYLVGPGEGGGRGVFYPRQASHSAKGKWSGGLPMFSTRLWGSDLIIAEFNRRGFHLDRERPENARITCIKAIRYILEIEREMPRPQVEMQQSYDGPRWVMLPT